MSSYIPKLNEVESSLIFVLHESSLTEYTKRSLICDFPTDSNHLVLTFSSSIGVKTIAL
jgi:hypothetical protein